MKLRQLFGETITIYSHFLAKMIVPDVLPDLAADLKKRDKISAHKLDSKLNITANVTEMVKFLMGSITRLVIKFAKALNKLQFI